MSTQLPSPSMDTPERHSPGFNRTAAGIALIAIGLLIGFTQIFHVALPGWLLLGGLALIFLVWGLLTRTFGLIIPGGILAGIGLGAFLVELPFLSLSETTQGGLFLVAFAAGWALITLLSPLTCDRFAWWPLIPGGILAAVGVILLIGGFGLKLLTLIGFAWPLLLLGAGVYLLLKRD